MYLSKKRKTAGTIAIQCLSHGKQNLITSKKNWCKDTLCSDRSPLFWHSAAFWQCKNNNNPVVFLRNQLRCLIWTSVQVSPSFPILSLVFFTIRPILKATCQFPCLIHIFSHLNWLSFHKNRYRGCEEIGPNRQHHPRTQDMKRAYVSKMMILGIFRRSQLFFFSS
jgi:hypothetical protein